MLYETSTLYTPCIPSVTLRNKTNEKIIGKRKRSAESLKEEKLEKKNKTKEFKPNNRHFAILFEISLRNKRRFSDFSSRHNSFSKPASPLNNENLNAFHDSSLVMVPLWIRPKSFEHARLKRRIFILSSFDSYRELSIIANNSRFCQKKSHARARLCVHLKSKR